MYHGSIPKKDVEQDALYLNMSKEEFLEKYLVIPLRMASSATAFAAAIFISSVIAFARTSRTPRNRPGNTRTLLI
jgi:hypothetical protein